jgi:uncharacterized protein (DUF1330 family)
MTGSNAMKAWIIFERISETRLDFQKEYRASSAASVQKYGGRYKAVSYHNPVIEGPGPAEGPKLVSIIEFDSRAQAEAWYRSPEYTACIGIREGQVVNRAIIIDADLPAFTAQAEAG